MYYYNKALLTYFRKAKRNAVAPTQSGRQVALWRQNGVLYGVRHNLLNKFCKAVLVAYGAFQTEITWLTQYGIKVWTQFFIQSNCIHLITSLPHLCNWLFSFKWIDAMTNLHIDRLQHLLLAHLWHYHIYVIRHCINNEVTKNTNRKIPNGLIDCIGLWSIEYSL